MPETLKPIFVCGHRKCGTTLLLNLCDSHPDLCVYPQDINLLYGYFPVYVRGDHNAKERAERLDAVVFKDLKMRLDILGLSDALSADQLRESFWTRMKGVPLDRVNGILEHLCRAFEELTRRADAPCKGVVIKETSIEIYAAQLFAWFPHAKFIHLLRDPRDNFAALKSGLRKYSHFGDDAKTILSSLLNRGFLGMRLAEIHQKRFGAARYKIIRFEDLALQPEKTMREICKFLNITFHDTMVVPTILGRPTKGNSFEQFDFSSISSRNVGRWAERIEKDEAKVIEFYFKELMTQYGYEPVFTSAEQADAAAEFYQWSNYKYHFYDRFRELETHGPAPSPTACAPAIRESAQGFTLWFTGLSGSGKSTVATLIGQILREQGYKVEVLDGDVIRTHISKGLGYSRADRDTNIRRIGWICEILNRNGVITVVAAISPYRDTREEVRRQIPHFVEVYMECPLEVLAARDAKGLYKKALAGELANFTGVSDPYEPPQSPDAVCHTDGRETPEQSAATVLHVLAAQGLIPEPVPLP